MRRIATLAATLLAALAIGGCTTTTLSSGLHTGGEGSRAILTTGTPGFALAANATYTFSPKSEALIANPQAAGAVSQVVAAELGSALAARGIREKGNGAGDVSITWVLAGAGVDDRQLTAKYGIAPGLVVDDNGLNKGTLIIWVNSPMGSQMLWRGAVQVAVPQNPDLAAVTPHIRDAAESLARAIPRK